MYEEAGEQQNRKYLRNTVKGIKYAKGKMLGSGGFAKCYEAIDQQNGKVYAAKVIPKKSINEKRQRYKLLIEIKLHRSLEHKHIVGFKEAFEDRQNVYILLEYCRNYTLKQLVKRRKRLTEHQARVYTAQLIKAIQYIHQHSIIHRDLKLGNILIDDNMDTKICDFGLSTKVKKQGEIKRTICGTPNYIAPEILEQQGHSYEVDIWSIGVILYTLLFGKPPFEDNTVQQTYENIRNNRFSFPSSVRCSMTAKNLISKILVMDPSKRLTLQEILAHDFMKIPIGLSNHLSCATLAIPPLNQDIQIQAINFNEVNIQQSSQISLQKDSFGYDQLDHLLTKRKQNTKFQHIFIRQIFQYKNIFGYLLSNGVIGTYHKNGVNYILDYGSQYYNISEPQKELKRLPIPQSYEFTEQVKTLMHFRSYFMQKYSVFKLDEMNKRQAKSDDVPYLKKLASIVQCREFLTRLSNSIIQLNYKDNTSVMINIEESQGIFYVDTLGKITRVQYNQCKNTKVKTKIRKFSHLLQAIANKKLAVE